ncbi:ubiquitin-like protein Pup [Streptomyces sp. HC307]|uniref:ubiquitin-like protein Pup n=1 Tax=Streptomyces flavusporus TaxID=3385496 RepID=UPI003916F8DB
MQHREEHRRQEDPPEEEPTESAEGAAVSGSTVSSEAAELLEDVEDLLDEIENPEEFVKGFRQTRGHRVLGGDRPDPCVRDDRRPGPGGVRSDPGRGLPASHGHAAQFHCGVLGAPAAAAGQRGGDQRADQALPADGPGAERAAGTRHVPSAETAAERLLC